MGGSIVGPTLLDLACRTNSKLENMSYIFTWRSVGYLAGSMVGGWLYDKFNKLRLLSLSCLVATAFMWVSPLTTNLYALMVFMAAISLAERCLDTGENQSLLPDSYEHVRICGNRLLSSYASVPTNSNLKSRLRTKFSYICCIFSHEASTSSYCSRELKCNLKVVYCSTIILSLED